MTRPSPPADKTDPLMPIGMFSRASLVSVKALRSYHELGLLVPAEIDPATSYRSYRVSQLADAVVVKRLRDLDLPLADIGEVVRSRDPEITRRVIKAHEVDMSRRLADVTRIVDELQLAIERPSLATPIHVRTEPAAHALSYSEVVDQVDYGSFLGGAFALLFEASQTIGADLLSMGSARYPAAVDSLTGPVEAYLAIAEADTLPSAVSQTGVVLALIPAATCAVATHVGSYETIGNSYRQLGAWVARHAVTADLPVREHYIVSINPATGELLPPDQLRTEICWPIVPTSGPSESVQIPTES